MHLIQKLPLLIEKFLKICCWQLSKDANISDKINSFSSGILLGTQHQLFKKSVVDIWIIGNHFGSSKSDLLVSYAADHNAIIAA